MYVDAYHNRDNDEIWIAERISGRRTEQVLPANYVFYYEDPKGKYQTIFGDSVSKFSTNKYSKFQTELKRIQDTKKVFESDINPIYRCLAENYYGVEPPELHIGFFDIEVDFNPDLGFAGPDDPHSPVTAITTHFSWTNELVTLALPPDTISFEEAEKLAQNFSNTYIFTSESELIKAWLNSIEDTDILSGWNSTGFDIPYMVKRTEKVLGKEYTKQFCLWNMFPRKRTFVMFNKEQMTYDLIGRVHLDYLDLFKKHSGQQHHSYKLDYIGELVTGEKKTEYEGTLDELYKNDFGKFIEYNRQDVDLLVKIDEKKKYIQLANQLAHTNTVLLSTTMGSVALIEQAIINEAHERGMVVPSKNKKESNEDALSVAGAYVADPYRGFHEWIGSVDINSLYPSVIRSLNMSPETLLGQIRSTYTKELLKERMDQGYSATDAWHDIFGTLEYNTMLNQENKTITLDMEDGSSVDLTGKELYDFIFNDESNICITANGTLFRKDFEGVIPGILEKWYNQRLDMKKKQKDHAQIQKGIEIDSDLEEQLKDV